MHVEIYIDIDIVIHAYIHTYTLLHSLTGENGFSFSDYMKYDTPSPPVFI